MLYCALVFIAAILEVASVRFFNIASSTVAIFLLLCAIFCSFQVKSKAMSILLLAAVLFCGPIFYNMKWFVELQHGLTLVMVVYLAVGVNYRLGTSG